MVIMTRSACRRASESMDSDNSQRSSIRVPPWCSSGRIHTKKKQRQTVSFSRETQSSYPLRENIWEFLQEDKTHFKRRIQQKYERADKENKGSGSKLMPFGVLFISAIGLLASYWICSGLPKTDLIDMVFPTKKIVSLLSVEFPTSVGEECCHMMRHLAAKLSRAEQALRFTRLRKTLMLTSKNVKKVSTGLDHSNLITDVTVTKGDDTEEWGAQVLIWGVPLGRIVPSTQIIVATRPPTPADCWPFYGSYGTLHFELPRKMFMSSISIEHIYPDSAKSALKNFEVFTILENNTWIQDLAEEYNSGTNPKQYFTLPNENNPRKHMAIRVTSNQGNPKYTCVYRIHLYGIVHNKN